VNNFEAGDSLVREAREFLSEADRAFDRESWNIVVRRAQEVVELSLKGGPKMMGIEYPKEHDVGRVFAQACRTRNLSIGEPDLVNIMQISAWLARERQPAFYMERQYRRAEAVRAREGAQSVLALVERLAEQLRGGTGL
jgi:HEPN domain-containing protein